MIARIATIVLSVAVTLVVPAILAVNGIRLVTNERYVEAVYDYGGVPDDRYGLSSAARERLALVGLESVQPSSEGISLLREARLPGGEAAFNARELAHMDDVRTAVARAYRFQLVAVAAIAVLALLFGLLGSSLRALVPVALVRGAVLTVVVAVVVGVVAATSYSSFETPFHWLFFEGETWRFEETDTLRRLYPDRFWLDTAVAIGVLCVLQAFVLFAVARFWARRAGARRLLRMQARPEGT